MARQIEMTVQGVLGTDPTLTESPGRRPFCHFRLANTPTYRAGDRWDEGDTIWFTVKAWGNLALNLSRSFRKGDPVLLLGRFTQETWQRRDDGAIQVTNVLTVTAGGHDLARGASHYSRIPVRAWDKQGNEILPRADAAASPRLGASSSSQSAQAPGGRSGADSSSSASDTTDPSWAAPPASSTGPRPVGPGGEDAWLVREDPVAGLARPAESVDASRGAPLPADPEVTQGSDGSCTDGELVSLPTDDPLSYEVVNSGPEAAE